MSKKSMAHKICAIKNPLFLSKVLVRLHFYNVISPALLKKPMPYRTVFNGLRGLYG